MMKTALPVQLSLIQLSFQKVIQRFFKMSPKQWPVVPGVQPCQVSKCSLPPVRTSCTCLSETEDITTSMLPPKGRRFHRAHLSPRLLGGFQDCCVSAPNSNPAKFCSHPYSTKTILSGCSGWASRFESQNFLVTKSDGTDASDGRTGSKEKMSYLEAKRRGLLAGRRSLSPTERLGEMVGVETNHRGSTGQGWDGNDTALSKSEHRITDQENGININVFDEAELDVSMQGVARRTKERCEPVAFQGNPPMVDDEVVLAVRENFKRHEYLCRMFTLNASKGFSSKYGTISHADIIGHPAGKTFTTDLGRDVLIRRPSLEEFVLNMKRIPVISYPKDCCTMLMMIDASPGDVILEAGSGSGAMTLFLSRSVGQGGRVHTFEAKPEHLKRAAKNVQKWASSWNICHPRQPWPENIAFHSGSLQSSHKDLDSALLVDGAVIDMERPQEAMPVLAARLKSGKAAALYIANITQVIEVAESLRVHNLPLTIEKTLEVTHKVWLVHQARRHSGISLAEVKLCGGSNSSPSVHNASDDLVSSSSYIEDLTPKYLARPHSEQPGHSAFLVKVRKIESEAATYKL